MSAGRPWMLTWRGGDEAQVILHLLDVPLDHVWHHGQPLVQLAAGRQGHICERQLQTMPEQR